MPSNTRSLVRPHSTGDVGARARSNGNGKHVANPSTVYLIDLTGTAPMIFPMVAFSLPVQINDNSIA